MKPTQYFEDGIANGNPFGVGTLGNRALYRTIVKSDVPSSRVKVRLLTFNEERKKKGDDLLWHGQQQFYLK